MNPSNDTAKTTTKAAGDSYDLDSLTANIDASREIVSSWMNSNQKTDGKKFPTPQLNETSLLMRPARLGIGAKAQPPTMQGGKYDSIFGSFDLKKKLLGQQAGDEGGKGKKGRYQVEKSTTQRKTVHSDEDDDSRVKSFGKGVSGAPAVLVTSKKRKRKSKP